jgi:NADH-quinone oxidoreductase subunit H
MEGLTGAIAALYAASEARGVPWIIPKLLVMTVVALVIIGFVSVMAMFLIWWERKISAHIQARYGPMRVGGWHGWAQSLADGIKLLIKEDVIPAGADKPVFAAAPIVVFAVALAMYVVVPFSRDLIITDLNIGVLYLIAISSFGVVGIIMAGWSSNNKYSALGALRSAAQAISYELPLVLSVMVVVMITGTMSMVGMVEAARPLWFIVPQALAFVTYLVAAVAETNRLPFDIPEAESELVAGFHVEYSGMRFAIFFLAEYSNMFIVSAIAVTLFLGGWKGPGVAQAPLLAGAFWFLIKTLFLLFLFMWLRWTLARLRVDQLLDLGWKILLPITFANLLVTGLLAVTIKG